MHLEHIKFICVVHLMIFKRPYLPIITLLVLLINTKLWALMILWFTLRSHSCLVIDGLYLHMQKIFCECLIGPFFFPCNASSLANMYENLLHSFLTFYVPKKTFMMMPCKIYFQNCLCYFLYCRVYWISIFVSWYSAWLKLEIMEHVN